MSSSKHRSKEMRLIDDFAKEYGVKLDIQPGGRHWKVYLEGKFISILPRGGNKSNRGRATLNSFMHIRRAIEAHINGQDTAAADE